MQASSQHALPVPMRLHHAARITRDSGATRRLVEDVLGIPLVATWCESFPHPEMPGKQFEFCHTFFQIADGSSLAFFQLGSEEDYQQSVPKLGAHTWRFDHTALKVSEGDLKELVRRVKEAGVRYEEVDHGYCSSLYVIAEDYTLEFATDPPNVHNIMASRLETARADLDRWLAGARSSNNNVRTDA